MLTLKNISKSYAAGSGRRKPVLDNICLTLDSGRIIGLAGPSGSGKTTLGRIILRLEKPDKGQVYLEGKNIWDLKGKHLQTFRKNVQIVPQHPDAAFNPRLKIRTSLMEVFRFHPVCPPENQEAFLLSTLAHVSLHPDLMDRYPAQLSGGEIQRLAIARAILTKPGLLVLDEITSMLDVSVQASIIRTLEQLHRDHCSTYLFITHDIDLARAFCHQILVLKDGKLSPLKPKSPCG